MAIDNAKPKPMLDLSPGCERVEKIIATRKRKKSNKERGNQAFPICFWAKDWVHCKEARRLASQRTSNISKQFE